MSPAVIFWPYIVPVLTATSRTRNLSSGMIRSPAASVATASGAMPALTAGPPSPLKKPLPSPATV